MKLLTKLFLVIACLMLSATQAFSASTLDDYSYYKKVLYPTDTVTVTADVLSFPIAVHINATSWSIEANRTHFITGNTNGKRVQFYTPEDTTGGTHTGADNAAVLTDSGKAWTIDALIGAVVYNNTDGSKCLITDNTETTVTCTLAGGTGNDWDTGDAYVIALAYEVEYYDANGGDCSSGNCEAIYWVRVPVILDGDNGTNNYIYIGYGNDPNSSDQDQPTSVWDSNFKGVWHLGNNSWAGSPPEALDSTSNNNDATDTGTADVAGQVGNAREWDSTDNIVKSASTDYNPTGNISISAYIYADTVANYKPIINNRGANVGVSSYNTALYLDSTGHLFWVSGISGWGWTAKTSTATVSTATWTHVGATVNSSAGTGIFYKNGAAGGTWSSAGAINYRSTDPIQIGYYLISGYDGPSYFDGKIDELRVSATQRSADWMKLEYYSMLKTNYNGDSWIEYGLELPLVIYEESFNTTASMTVDHLSLKHSYEASTFTSISDLFTIEEHIYKNKALIQKDYPHHNAFPGVTQNAEGTYIISYRKGLYHDLSTDYGEIYKRTSTDLVTWTDEELVYSRAEEEVDIRDPQLTTLSNGNIILSFCDRFDAVAGNRAYVLISEDDGDTWSGPYAGNSDFTLGEGSSSPIVEFPNGDLGWSIHALDIGDTNESCAFLLSEDGGVTWNQISVMEDGDVWGHRCVEPNVWIEPDGTLFGLLRLDDTSGPRQIWKITSTDGGYTWGESSFAFYGDGSPHMVVTSDGTLHWTGRTGSTLYGGNCTTATSHGYKYSIDKGSTWSDTQCWNGCFDEEIYCKSSTYAAPYVDNDGRIFAIYGQEYDVYGELFSDSLIGIWFTSVYYETSEITLSSDFQLDYGLRTSKTLRIGGKHYILGGN